MVLAGAVGAYLCHDKMKVATKIACQLLLVLAIAAPISDLVGSIASGDFSLPEFPLAEDGGAYEEVAKDAFLKGISIAIQDKYGISAEEVYVGCDGFDFESMTAKRIYVTLMGRGAFSDYKAVKIYVEDNFGGDCVVEIELG